MLEAPDVYYAAAVMKQKGFLIGSGDLTAMIDLMCQMPA